MRHREPARHQCTHNQHRRYTTEQACEASALRTSNRLSSAYVDELRFVIKCRLVVQYTLASVCQRCLILLDGGDVVVALQHVYELSLTGLFMGCALPAQLLYLFINLLRGEVFVVGCHRIAP